MKTRHPAHAAIMALLLSVIFAGPTRAAADREPDQTFPPAILELSINSQGFRMPALLYQANGQGPHPTVVLLHGFPGNEKNLDVAQELRRHGFNVLFFHYRGAWGAEGKYAILNLDEDTGAVLSYLRDPQRAQSLRVDPAALSLLGHSLGGFTALAAGKKDQDLVCVGAISPANVGLWKLGLDSKDSNSKRLLSYADSLYMLNGFSKSTLLSELRSASLADVDIRTFGPGLKGKSVFMIVGDRDLVTTPQSMFSPAVSAYQAVPGMQLEHHIISGDHSFSWSRQALTEHILNWMNRDCRQR